MNRSRNEQLHVHVHAPDYARMDCIPKAPASGLAQLHQEEVMNTTELKKLAEAATPGPWIAAGPYFGDPLPRYCNEVLQEDEDYPYSICRAPQEMEDTCTADMEYIAAANPAAILKLLAINAELANQLHVVRIQCESMAASDWRKWEELASPDEFERWVKSRASHMAVQATAVLAKAEGGEL